MSIADKNLVDELSSGDVTLPKIGMVLASLYLQTDRQGSVQIEQGKALARLEQGQADQKKVNEATLAQTTRTNGRVTELERKQAANVSCPGKCIPLAQEIEELKAIVPRIEKLEEPVKAHAVVASWIQTRWGIATSVLAVILAILAVPAVSDYIFVKKEVAAVQQVSLTKDDIAQIVSEQIRIAQQHQTTAQTPAPQTTKKP